MSIFKQYRGFIYTLSGAFGWGLSGVCSQYLFMNYKIDSAWLTMTRMILSGILLLSFSGLKAKNTLFSPFKNSRDRLWIFSFGILGLLLCQYAYLSSIQYSNSGTATVLQSLNILFMILFIALKNKKMPALIHCISLVLALSGVYLIAAQGNLSSIVLSSQGLFWGLVSAIAVVIYTLISHQISSQWSNTLITGWGMLIGGVTLSLFQLTRPFPNDLDLKAFIIIAFIVLFGTAIAFTLFLKGVSEIGPINASLLACMEPISATFFSWFLLNTLFSKYDLTGFLLIITAGLMVSTKKIQPNKRS